MNKKRMGLLVGVALFAVGAVANAATIEYDFNTEFSGGQAPTGAAPWIVATFVDASPGHVTLTINSSRLSGNENISEIDFNFVPDTFVAQLNFTSLNGSVGTIAANSISKQKDKFKADGDGLYDISFVYSTGSGFNKNLTSSYDITYSGVDAFGAASFFALSAPSGGHGPFYSAAHVQNTAGIGNGGSGWVAPIAAVPLPAALPMFIFGMGYLGAFIRRRRP